MSEWDVISINPDIVLSKVKTGFQVSYWVKNKETVGPIETFDAANKRYMDLQKSKGGVKEWKTIIKR